AQLETKLKTNPNDIESRKMLLRFYSDYEIKPTPARAKSRLRHRLWFVQNRPEMTETEIFGFGLPYGTTDEGEYQILKAEWLKQVAANKTNAQIRLNAVAFLRYEEPETAENLLLEGQKINGEDYRFPFLLSDIYHDQAESFENAENPAKIKEFFQKGFETGEKALILLKKERSASRDYDRRELLQNLVVSAFQMEKFDRAKSFATELILDFGQDSTDSGYTKAAHIGNIYLGRAALREGNTAKAKEHLLIAVRAPLRQEGSYLSEIDTELAKELFNKGEKEAVLEYLKLSESLWHLKTQPELYEDELKALKLWQEQIRQGKTPSFNFYEP
ncbi:MAG TPA: hypothetical protein VK892_24050, partial [Pyrinomonadaceae bacterium]|nr:hypothetical protein [Pyrinomonadaceae bacterium]